MRQIVNQLGTEFRLEFHDRSLGDRSGDELLDDGHVFYDASQAGWFVEVWQSNSDKFRIEPGDAWFLPNLDSFLERKIRLQLLAWGHMRS